jgi:hypothetical protein
MPMTQGQYGLANAYRVQSTCAADEQQFIFSRIARCVAVTREGAGWDSDLLASIGQQLGAAESLELGRLANSNPPELLRYDATGSAA